MIFLIVLLFKLNLSIYLTRSTKYDFSNIATVKFAPTLVPLMV